MLTAQRRFAERRANACGSGTGGRRHLGVPISTDANVRLLLVTHEPLEGAQSRAIFTYERRCLGGQDPLVRTGLHELADPQTAGVAS